MQDNIRRIAWLVSQFTLGKLNEAEKKELQDWRDASALNEAAFQRMTDVQQQVAELADYQVGENEKKAAWQELQQKMERTGRKVFDISWQKYLGAAAILAIAIVGLYIWSHNRIAAIPDASVEAPPKADLPPGHFGAVLTLAGGKTILLDSTVPGELARQGSTKLVKTAAGEVIYTTGNVPNLDKAVLNTLVTPRAGQFSLVLPDGSRVWLNSASSLRYPTAFTGNDRLVELTGEAYFEVAKNPKMPFLVQVNSMTIRVLGTSFNVNAYDDEPHTITTLLEGSIKVSSGGSDGLLRPGEQAQARNNAAIRIIPDADIDKAIAWKQGLFQFKGDDIPTILRQVARWYNVNVTYEKDLPRRTFSGKISRSVNLSEVLKILETVGFHFRIKDKSLEVMR